MKFNCSYKEILDASSLRHNPKNPNKHSKDQIERLAKIIEYQGQRSPIVVSNQSGFITKGHGRLEAMKRLGWKRVAVDFQDYDSDEQEYADIVADNAIADWAELDFSMINSDLTDLGPDFDIDLLGLKDFEIDVADKELGDEEETPEPPKESKVVKGEVYILGDHRLMCGDSTVITDVEKLMNGEKAQISFTSPPYNAGSLNVKGNDTTKKKYNKFDDNQSESEFFNFLNENLKCLMIASDEIFYNIGLVENNKRVILEIMHTFKDTFKDIIYWEKSTVAPHIQAGVINNLVEFILCFGDGKRKFKNAQFSQGTYWNVIKGKNASGNEFSKIHKATFPVYLAENIIENFTSKNGSVVDSFGGTGTTLIACEKTNRKCYMMELDEYYCHVILERWQKYTGRKAIREDGKLWDEIKEVSNG